MAIESGLRAVGELDPDQALSGYLLVYEAASGEERVCGHIYGPRLMTTWRALGLLEWARRFTLGPEDE